MKSLIRNTLLSTTALACTTAAALACGTPPEKAPPPPPPPDPPIVCCVVIDWQIDPDDPNWECLIVRYFRMDGMPLFQSNPMPLPPFQQCACAVPPLPDFAEAKGVHTAGFSFSPFADWAGLPPDAPGFGPFQPNTDPSIQAQVDDFFNIYYQAAGGTATPPPSNRLSDVFSFAGPGDIPPGVFFDVFQKIRIPAGWDPRQLCVPGQMAPLGLFLVDNGQVLAEPGQAGAPPLPLPQFAMNPGAGAFYKFKWYPIIVPPPCPPLPPGCPWDFDGDGVVGSSDLAELLGRWGPC